MVPPAAVVVAAEGEICLQAEPKANQPDGPPVAQPPGPQDHPPNLWGGLRDQQGMARPPQPCQGALLVPRSAKPPVAPRDWQH